MENAHLRSCASICQITAVSTLSMIDEYPCVARVPVDDWRYFVCALMFRAFIDVINQSNISNANKREIIETNMKSLKDTFPDFSKALYDLENFIVEFRDASPQVMGLWLGANLFQKDSRALSQEEYEVGTVVAATAARGAADFLIK